jgi:hypothetical protein
VLLLAQQVGACFFVWCNQLQFIALAASNVLIGAALM